MIRGLLCKLKVSPHDLLIVSCHGTVTGYEADKKSTHTKHNPNPLIFSDNTTMTQKLILLLLYTLSLSIGGLASNLRDVVMIVDGSGSISAEDFRIQKDGMIAGINSLKTSSVYGDTSISIVQYAGSMTRTELGYRIPQSSSDLDNIISIVNAIVQIGGLTNPGDGINTATNLLSANYGTYASSYQRYCLFTDGIRNGGASVESAISTAKNANFGLDSFAVLAILDGGLTETDFYFAYGSLVFEGNVVVFSGATEFANAVAPMCFAKNEDVHELVALEVTQATQDLNNGIPLIRGKRTMVRAYIKSPTSATSQLPLTIRLRGKDKNGNKLPGSPLTATNSAGRITPITDPISYRHLLSATANFLLPESWTSQDELQLTVENVGTDLKCTPTDCTKTVSLVTANALQIRLYAVSYVNAATNQIVGPSKQDMIEAVREMTMLYPTSGIALRDNKYEHLYLGKLTFVDAQDVIKQLDAARGFWYSGYLSVGIMAPSAKLRAWYNNQWNDIYGVAPGKMSVSRHYGIGFGDMYDRYTVSHEVGHQLGLPHPVYLDPSSNSLKGFCGAASAEKSAFPYVYTQNGKYKPMLGPFPANDKMSWVYGWDSVTEVADDKIVPPQDHFELMSYCGPKRTWISKASYEKLYNNHFKPFFSFSSSSAESHKPMLPQQHLTASVQEEYYVYRISVELGTDVISFGPVVTHHASSSATSSPTSAPTTSVFDNRTYTLALLNENAIITKTIPFDVEEVFVHDVAREALPSIGYATVLVPASEAPKGSIAVQRDGTVLSELTASASRPNVTVIFPNGGESLPGPFALFVWEGVDADGDSLTYSVFFSANSGTTWFLIATDIADTELNVSLSSLTESSNALLKVQVSDGFLVNEDRSDGTFITPNNLPEVTIISPSAGDVFGSVQTITLQAVSTDSEDGSLTGASVVWTSSRDGRIGSGSTLLTTADMYSEGDHVITATATDSAGAFASDSIEITVYRIAPFDEPAPGLVVPFQVGLKRNAVNIKISKKGKDLTKATIYILSTDMFNATDVDVNTLTLGPTGTPVLNAGGKGGKDKKVKGKNGKGNNDNGDGLVDADKDGHVDDLLVKFEGIGVRCNDTEVVLKGSTVYGDTFESRAPIVTTGKTCDKR